MPASSERETTGLIHRVTAFDAVVATAWIWATPILVAWFLDVESTSGEWAFLMFPLMTLTLPIVARKKIWRRRASQVSGGLLLAFSILFAVVGAYWLLPSALLILFASAVR